MSAPQDGRALLARIQPTKRRERIQMCMRPDLILAHEEASDALTESTVTVGERLAGGAAGSAESKRLAKKVQEIEAAIEGSSMWFILEQLGRPRWQEILDAHPPREDHQIDWISGYNRDGVLDQAIRECLIDPVFEDCEDPVCDHSGCGSWQQFEKFCPGGEWAELRNVVNVVNSGVVDPPKSVLASRILAPRGRGSAPQKSGV